jgi:hypothetical protein
MPRYRPVYIRLGEGPALSPLAPPRIIKLAASCSVPFSRLSLACTLRDCMRSIQPCRATYISALERLKTLRPYMSFVLPFSCSKTLYCRQSLDALQLEAA